MSEDKDLKKVLTWLGIAVLAAIPLVIALNKLAKETVDPTEAVLDEMFD